jgi:protein phosphatase
LEREFIARIQGALTKADLWSQFNTDWFALDCELMPWSAKAMELVRTQYAAVGTAALASVSQTVTALSTAMARDLDTSGLLEKYNARLQMVTQYRDAYRRYCWKVDSLDDIKLAPFHLLATENAAHFDKNHQWHMDVLSMLSQASEGMIISTPYKTIEVTIPESVEEGIAWWRRMTDVGGEGMVVKPLDFIAQERRGLVQPAVKCRGPEYLRIIYGPEYTAPQNLERLRNRGLGRKRSLAIREFALGIEALERFVRHEPLYRVHECVFGVLALESEPVDPRL